MATLKRTPIDRPGGDELVRRIAGETAELPPTRREPAVEQPPVVPMQVQMPQGSPNVSIGWPAQPVAARPVPSTATEQINFRGSPGMATTLARLAAEQGSIRLVIARLLQAAGHPVPEVDLQPPPGRRRLG